MKPLAKTPLKRFSGLGADKTTLLGVAGMGEASAAQPLAVRAARVRFLRAEVQERPIIGSWQALIDDCRAQAGFAGTEEFRLLFFERKNVLIGDERQQRGTVDHASVYPREVLKRTLELGASTLIMVQSHPSDEPTPSKADIDMTCAVAKALAASGIALHDHAVFGRGRHASLKSLGLI